MPARPHLRPDRAAGYQGLVLLLPLLLASSPGDLAPGIPEVQASEAALAERLSATRAVATAVSRLQAEWTVRSPLVPPKGGRPAGPCDDAERVAVGWRIERFGAAWRELTQATVAEAGRVRRTRGSPVAAPLIDADWGRRLDALLAEADTARAAFLEASAWQARFVRPVLATCPAPELAPAPGFTGELPAVRGSAADPIAVLGFGDGVVCPGALPADGSVLLLPAPSACWEVGPGCACEAAPVAPGAVLGPAPEPPEASEPQLVVPDAARPARSPRPDPAPAALEP